MRISLDDNLGSSLDPFQDRPYIPRYVAFADVQPLHIWIIAFLLPFFLRSGPVCPLWLVDSFWQRFSSPDLRPSIRGFSYLHLVVSDRGLESRVRAIFRKHEPQENEPYYPIPKEDNRDRYNLYLKEAHKLNGSVLLAGRLADYKYYNMDQAAARALKLFEEEIARR